MRCPKCGYISFDYRETCNKCNKSLVAEMQKFTGGAFDLDAPDFLEIPNSEASEQEVSLVEADASEFEVADENFDFLASDDQELFFEEEVADNEVEAEEEELVEQEEEHEIAFPGASELNLETNLTEPLVENSPSLEGELELPTVDLPLESEHEDELEGSKQVESTFDEFRLDGLFTEEDEKPEQDDSVEMEFAGFFDDDKLSAKPTADDGVDMDAPLDFELDLNGLDLNKKENI